MNLKRMPTFGPFLEVSMQTLRHLPLGLSLGLYMSGCATSTISFQSSPSRVQVYASTLAASVPILIGETPFVAEVPELEKQLGGSAPLNIEFRKDGYVTRNSMISDVGAADISLNIELTPSSGLEEPEKLNKVVDWLFEGQHLARAGRYDDAMKKLKEAEKESPQVAAIYELEGAIYYINKKYKEALDSYSTAVRVNPKNFTSIKMRNSLEAKLGVKRAIASLDGATTQGAGAVVKKEGNP